MIHCGTLFSPPCQMLTAATDSCWPRGFGAAAFLILSQLNQCLNYGSKSKWKNPPKKTKKASNQPPVMLLEAKWSHCTGCKLFALRFPVSENQLWWFVSSLKWSIFLAVSQGGPWFSSGVNKLQTLRSEAIIALILVTSSITLQDQTCQVKHNS